MKINPSDFEKSAAIIQMLLDEQSARQGCVVISRIPGDGFDAKAFPYNLLGLSLLPTAPVWSGYVILASQDQGAVVQVNSNIQSIYIGGPGAWESYWLVLTQAPETINHLRGRAGISVRRK